MFTALSKKLLYTEIENTNLFEFTTKDYKLILAGYPVLRAFTVATDSDIWIEIQPQLDVTKRIVFIPQIDMKQSKKLKALKWDVSLLEDLFIETPDIYIQNVKKTDEFFNTIPADISLAVNKFPDSHWELIKAINFLGKDILSVMLSNPALVYIIVNIDKINSSFFFYNEIELLKKTILTKQKEILGLCGFPGTEQLVKLFSKIDPGILSIKDMISFRDLLINNSMTTKRILNILSFAKIIDKNLFNLILHHTPVINLVSNKFIYELASSKLFKDNSAKIKWIYLASNRWDIKIPKIKSLESLNKVYEKLFRIVEMKRRNKESFPKPPIEDSNFISAICNERDLHSWSKQQQNCVRSYAEKVHAGHSYFYRVMNNSEQATLEVELKKNKINIGDLLGKRNSKVSNELRIIVDEWFVASKKNHAVKN